MVNDVTVCGIFRSRCAVERAIEILREEGFRSPDISVSVAPAYSDDLVEPKYSLPEHSSPLHHSSLLKTSTGGKVLGWLSGVVAFVIPIPHDDGHEEHVHDGEQSHRSRGHTALSVPLSGDAMLGTLGGMDDHSLSVSIRDYQMLIQAGGILLTVRASKGAVAEIANEVLEDAGAQFIATHGPAATMKKQITAEERVSVVSA